MPNQLADNSAQQAAGPNGSAVPFLGLQPFEYAGYVP